MKRVQLLACVVLSLAVGRVWADDRVWVDVVETPACKITLTDADKGNRSEPGCKDVGSACRHPGEKVQWVLRHGSHDYSIRFTDKAPPFSNADKCLSGATPCKIPTDTAPDTYEYTVDIASLPGCDVDPRIIIN